MRAGLVALAVLACSVMAFPASACDPDSDWCGWREIGEWSPPEAEERWSEPAFEEVDEPEPLAPEPQWEAPEYTPWEPPTAYEPPEPAERVYEPPAREVAFDPGETEPRARIDPIVESPSPWNDRPDPGVENEAAVPPNKWDEAARMGAHRVTDVYVGDTVTRNDRTTTWTTTTVNEEIDTAARLISDVRTGEASGLEGVLWNGRMRRADGSFVRGKIFENLVWLGGTWVHDKFVFFQDDSETDPLQAVPVPPPEPTVDPGAPPSAAPPLAAPASAPAPIVAIVPPASQPPEREMRGDGAPPAAPAAAAHDVRAGIALAPEGDALASVEVLRGRAVRLWPRALVDGVPARVTAWRIRSAELTALGPVAGRGDVPLLAMWERVSAHGAEYAVAVDVDVEVPGGTRTVEATIAVAVRSPALVE